MDDKIVLYEQFLKIKFKLCKTCCSNLYKMKVNSQNKHLAQPKLSIPINRFMNKFSIIKGIIYYFIFISHY